MLKNKSGITLIALIITIIVLLILAGITISLVVGDNGILSKSMSSKEKTVIGREEETISVSWSALITNKLANNEEITDESFEQELINNGNDVTVSYDENENFLVHFNDTGHNYVVDGTGKIGNPPEEPTLVPTNPTVASGTVKFSTEYGRIEVIWLSGTSNTVASSPNAPNLSGMTPVSWTLNGNTWEEDATASADYYSYTAETGTADNTTSRWANAKNSDGSYFVWIPRYAYRITYYESETSTEPTGYYDGYGQWRVSDGGLRIALDSGIETVDYNNKKYIVHPAFCGTSVGYDNGSWSENLTGFWVAKYEMSFSTYKSIPNVQSERTIRIGRMYTVSKSYDASKESHLMKNSEWGAVAYLTHSQYGRNGNEIDINNSSSCITGNGGGSTNAQSASGTTNAYNTTIGAKASTTGNVYGVYDMSGGAMEYVAVLNNTDTNNYSSNGNLLVSTSGLSNKYATKYLNETTSASGNSIIYTYGKIGDATKEVNKGGSYVLNSASGYGNWFEDAISLCCSRAPFVLRGGHYAAGSPGLFSSCLAMGRSASDYSFRVVLCP